MRILFLHSATSWTGTARVFAAAARALGERGYPVMFVCAQGSEVERRVSFTGFEVVTLPGMGSWRREVAALRRLIRDRFIEVVFVHGERGHAVAAAAVRLAARGAIVRRIAPDETPGFGARSWLSLRLAAGGLLVSDAGALPPPPIGARMLEPEVADLGVRPEEYDEPAGRTVSGGRSSGGVASPFTIAVLLDGAAPAAAATALRAAALLAPRHPGLRLTMLGVGPGLGDTLRLHAAALGISHALRIGDRRDDRLPALRRADLVWVIARGDDAAWGALDGMALRLPVFADRQTTASRFVAPDQTGAVLPPGDPHAAAAGIAALMGDPARRLTMGAAGRERVARTWPLDAMADGFQRAAEHALDRSRWIV
jgi:hypothetical protein